MRPHLASLVEDFRAHHTETAVVLHRGVRRYASSYGDLVQLAGRFSAELEHRGIAPGERVVLWGENSEAWIGAFFGCLLRGVLAVPLDAAGTVEFARRVLIEVTPRLIVGDAILLGRLRPEMPSLVFSEMTSHLPLAANFRVSEAVKEEAPFQIVFTSGTTSEPKGIVHTHRNVLASLRPIEAEIAKYRRYERWVHPLRFLHTLPLSHVFGQFMGLWIPALLAAEVHFTDTVEPARVVELIHRERISAFVAVPRVVGFLRTHLLRRFPSLAIELEHANALSILKRWWSFRAVHRAFGLKFWAIISGGASMPAELERFWNRLGFSLIQGYGMTETAALITLNHPFHVGQGTVGKVLPGREVRLSDGGEIMVRGDMVSSAIWQEGRMQPREGDWLATGDLAEQNDSGELRFMGRKGDAIVTSAGLNIHPSDLEAAMKQQPGVRECVVIPCEFARGAEPVTVVLFNGDPQALQRAVIDANRGLTEYQQIRRFLRWPEADFPYNATGKLLRRKVKDWACAALQDRVKGMASGGSALLSLVAEITGERVAETDDNLRLSEDLHLDSLGRVQLASLIEERMQVPVQEDELAGMETLGELRTLFPKSEAGGSDFTALSGSVPAPGGPFADDNSSPATGVDDAQRQPIAELTSFQSQSMPPQHAYPHWPWMWFVRALRVAFIEVVLCPLVRFLGAPRILSSRQDLPQESLLIIANHVTAVDGALVLCAIPRRLRQRLAIAMSGEMLLEFRKGRGQRNWLRNILAPGAYWLLTALFNVFPLPRLGGFRQSFAHAGEAMDHGYSVLIFPEGTRSRNGRMQPFRPGIGLLATQSRAPVLPVALLGLEDIGVGKGKWFRSGRIEIRIGGIIRMPEQTAPADWTHTLETVMQQLRS